MKTLKMMIILTIFSATFFSCDLNIPVSDNAAADIVNEKAQVSDRSLVSDLTGKTVRIRNRWTGKYIHDEYQYYYAQVGTINSDWWSAKWVVENHDGYLRFKNLRTGDYLHNELQYVYTLSGTIQSYWHSADWIPSDHDGYTRLKNRWTSQFMHTESNTLMVQLGTVGATWWSADWAFEIF